MKLSLGLVTTKVAKHENGRVTLIKGEGACNRYITRRNRLTQEKSETNHHFRGIDELIPQQTVTIEPMFIRLRYLLSRGKHPLERVATTTVELFTKHRIGRDLEEHSMVTENVIGLIVP